MEVYKDLIIVALAIIVLSIIQSYLAGKKPWYAGLFIPGVYWAFMIPYIIDQYIKTNEIRLSSDYYSASSFFFSGIWFILLYYTVFFYQKWRGASENKHGGLD